MRLLILLFGAACGQPASPPPPSPTTPAPPIAIRTTAPPDAAATPDAPARVAPTCVTAGSGFSEAHLVDGAVIACYATPLAGDTYVDDCWRFDLTTRAWQFANSKPHVDSAPPRAQVTATATRADVCNPDGSDCNAVPLQGVAVSPDDTVTGVTNADRSIVAVWAGGPMHVFDATGTRLTTIKPWVTSMNAPESSFFQGAHVLGSVLAVRIADSPITAAIRLFDARTGKKIADVFRGGPMDDDVEPIELGGTEYAFVTAEPRSILVVDVATGKQRARYPLGDKTLGKALIARVDGGLAGVVARTGFVVDSGKLSTVIVPTCPQPDEE